MEKPLPLPFIDPLSPLNGNPANGCWEAWEAAGVKGWTLKCLPVFRAEIRYLKHRRLYSLDLNGVAMGEHENLAPLQDRVEREIIARVRGMLPAYRVIHARMMERQGEAPAADAVPGPPGHGCTSFRQRARPSGKG